MQELAIMDGVDIHVVLQSVIFSVEHIASKNISHHGNHYDMDERVHS